MPITINIKIELGDQFLKDIMCTMIESGHGSIFYWGNVDNVVRDEETKDVLSFHVIEDEPGKYLGRMGVTMNSQVLARTIEQTLRARPPFFNRTLMDYLIRGVREQDAGDIDSDVADALVQIAMFDEVVYG